MDRFIKEELERLDEAGLRRTLVELDGPQGPRALVGGKEVIVLCSNDYLGLAASPELKEAAARAVERYGAGAGASRLVSGNMEPHRELEERIRTFKGSESAVLFNSGYNANLSVITTLADRSTEIFSDRLNHASIIDGCLLSRARLRRYAHGDPESLETLLRRSTARRRLVITEGVFSMDGDVPPLGDIINLARRYGAILVIDDAHGVGALGRRGKGTLEHLSIPPDPSVVEIGTFGKAFGSFGAFVSGSRELKELIISKARPFVYTTALPPAVCLQTTRAVDIVESGEALRERLHGNAAIMRKRLKAESIDTLGSSTQIIPAVIGGAEDVMEISRRLLGRGVYIQGIRPPTVPRGTARLRITVTAMHAREDIEYAAGAVAEVFREVKGAAL